jgi:hypothetical protein
MPWGYQKYVKTLYTYSAIEVRPALKKNLRSSISPNGYVNIIAYFNPNCISCTSSLHREHIHTKKL